MAHRRALDQVRALAVLPFGGNSSLLAYRVSFRDDKPQVTGYVMDEGSSAGWRMRCPSARDHANTSGARRRANRGCQFPNPGTVGICRSPCGESWISLFPSRISESSASLRVHFFMFRPI